MLVNWKRFSFGALLLASLSLLLLGCGDRGGSQTARKSISGVVSDPATGLALADAKVTAYGIDANGAQSGVPLGNPQSVQSDNKGRYRLHIPAGYAGSVMLEATKPASPVAKLAKLLSLSAADGVRVRAAVPRSLVTRSTIPPVMIGFASNMVVQYLIANNSGVFSSENILRAMIVLETFFGANFSQTPPPGSAADGNTWTAQQDLLVSIRAINSFTQGSDAAVVAVVAALNLPGGIGSIADDIKIGIANAITALKAQGILPVQYRPSAAINTAISNAQFAAVSAPSPADGTAPAAPSRLDVVGATAKSVSLGWNLSPDADVAGYLVYRADSSGIYVCVGSVGPDGASFSDFSVAHASAYSYQVAAFDAGRNLSDVSNAVTVATAAAADFIAPTAPAGLICRGLDYRQVNLQWLQSTKTVSDGTVLPAARYDVYRDGRFLGSTVETSYVDFGVGQSTSYSYYVRASDADANLSPASTTMTVRTDAVPGAQPPQAPTGLAATQSTQSFDNTPLTWTASTSAAAQAVTYNVYRDGYAIAVGIVPTSYHDNSVSPRTSYVYTVTAVANRFESGPGNPVTVVTPANPALTDIVAPTVPTNLSIVAVASNSVSLAWAASTKPGGDRIVAGYDVLRGDGAGTNYVKVATVTQAAYVDTNNVAASTSYSYMVRSFGSAGVRSAAGLPAGVATPARIDLADTTAPNAPAGLASPSATSNAVALTWSAATKANADATHYVAGYLVYRNGSRIADAHNLLYFTDWTATAATTYAYTVKAYDNSGNISAASGALAVTTPAAVPNSYNVSGKVTLNGVGLFGVVLTNGVTAAQAVSDVNGNYSFTGLAAGDYIITPTSTVFVQFSPGNRSIRLGASRSGVDFAATLTGVVTGGIDYPDGTVIGGISFPAGTVIGGVTYPAGTIVGGVFYPTGTVIGGILYPDGVVIGGVTYPPGTVVGGIAFPVGAVITGVTYPIGTVIGGVVYPAGSVVGTVGYPSGVVAGGVTYPTGVVVGGVAYPVGAVVGGVTYPNGAVVGGVTYPTGVVTGGVVYPTGGVLGGVSYPTGSATGGVIYPLGGVLSGATYGDGAITGTLDYRYVISGKATDSAGGFLADAAVTVPGTAYATRTDALGNYLLRVPTGSYTLRAALAGYTFQDSAPVAVDGVTQSATAILKADP